MRKVKLTESSSTYSFFVEVPKDASEVAPILRLVRDLAPSMPFNINDAAVASSMNRSWIEIEKRSSASHYDVDPYKDARGKR